MSRIDDETLAAFADGELGPVDEARVRQAIEEDPDLRARVKSLRRLREKLAAHYGPAAEEPVPQRFLDMLDTKIVPLRPRPAGPRWWQAATAMAATLVLGLLLGQAIPSGSPVAAEDGLLVAQGQLAEALDTQLASAQSPDSPVRIGVTFPGPDGRLCRTFESAAADGLACRGDDRWQLLVATTGSAGQSNEYRQAGSGSALVLQAAQEMMAGDPLDAEAERRARDSGWD